MLDFSLIKPYQFLTITVHLLFLRWLLLLLSDSSCVDNKRKFLQGECVHSWLALCQL